MDERIYRLVMSQPIPMRLADAIYNAPLLDERTIAQMNHVRAWNRGNTDPDSMTPQLLRILVCVSNGLTSREIADRTGYAFESVRGMRKALMAMFQARNEAHLAALAVAQGYVDMKLGLAQVPTRKTLRSSPRPR